MTDTSGSCNTITNTRIIMHNTADGEDAQSLVSDIGYRLCHFLDIEYRYFQKLAYRSDTTCN